MANSQTKPNTISVKVLTKKINALSKQIQSNWVFQSTLRAHDVERKSVAPLDECRDVIPSVTISCQQINNRTFYFLESEWIISNDSRTHDPKVRRDFIENHLRRCFGNLPGLDKFEIYHDSKQYLSLEITDDMYYYLKNWDIIQFLTNNSAENAENT